MILVQLVGGNMPAHTSSQRRTQYLVTLTQNVIGPTTAKVTILVSREPTQGAKYQNYVKHLRERTDET